MFSEGRALVPYVEPPLFSSRAWRAYCLNVAPYLGTYLRAGFMKGDLQALESVLATLLLDR